MRLTIIFLILMVGNQSCKTVKTNSHSADLSKIIIYQNGKEIPIENGNQSLEIEGGDFAIRFYNKKYNPDAKQFYSAQVAALPSKEDFQKIKVGMKQEETSCFIEGTGMAASESTGYESLIISSTEHHYLTYQNEEQKRVNLIGRESDFFKFEFSINSLSINGEKFLLKDKKVKELFLSIMIDRNLNEIIDEGELTNLTLKIK